MISKTANQMCRKTIFTNFIDSPYFTKQDLLVLSDKFDISKTSLNTLIQRGIKNRIIIPLKRNYYVSHEFFLKNKGNIEYKFYLANVLLKPSYISRETALQYYGLLSEAVANYTTSTSTKVTKKFENSFGVYEYRNIKPVLFMGYKIVKFSMNDKEYSYAIALPYKAIYDYLYYRINIKTVSEDDLLAMLEEFRISYEDLSKKEFDKLVKLFK